MSSSSSEVFYGVYVNTFTLGVAVEAYKGASGPLLAIGLIFNRRQNETLITKPGARGSIKDIPKEIWNEIKGYVFQQSIKGVRKALARRIWGKCKMSCITDDPGEILLPGDLKADGGVSTCVEYEWEELSTACYPCSKNGLAFYKSFFSATKGRIMDELLDLFGLTIVSEEQFCHRRLHLRQGDFEALTAIRLKNHSRYYQAPEVPKDYNKHSYSISFGPLKSKFQPIPFPTSNSEKLQVDQQFKLFIDTYEVQPTPYASLKLVPDDDGIQTVAVKGKDGYDVNKPKWIKFSSIERDPIEYDDDDDYWW